MGWSEHYNTNKMDIKVILWLYNTQIQWDETYTLKLT